METVLRRMGGECVGGSELLARSEGGCYGVCVGGVMVLTEILEGCFVM